MLFKDFSKRTRTLELIHKLEGSESIRSFAGFRMIQTWTTLYMLEFIFRLNPNIKRIVDIGTGGGGLALFFGIHMFHRNGEVLACDVNDKRYEKEFESKEKEPRTKHWYRFLTFLPITFIKRSAISNEVIEEVKKFIKDEQTLILVDSDALPEIKKLEFFNKYARILKPNDFILCHDYPSEIKIKDIPKDIQKFLELYRQEDWDNMKTQMLSMRRKKNV